ncbi:phage tail tip protein [Aeromonas caviae]
MPHKIPQTIRFVIIRNPLVPDAKHIEERELIPGQPLSGYIGELSGRYAFSVNGRILPQDDLHLEIPSAGDVIAIAPIPMGGGGNTGKTIVRLVAVVALTYFSMGTGAYTLSGLTSMAAGSAGLVAAGAAVMIGGTLAINALLPYSSMNNKTRGGSGTESRTYGIDGAKNTSEDGLPVPVTYGRHRQAGNIIGNYTTMNGQTQYLHLLINAGEGVIAGVKPGSILINDQPLDSLTDVEYRVLNGNDGQDTTNIFDQQIIPNQVTVNREMKKASVWTEFTTSVSREVEGVRLDFLSNIYKMDDQGNQKPHQVDVIAEIKPFGAPDSMFRPLTTGVSQANADKGWRIDIAGERLVVGEIVEVKRGSQLIDKTRPNIFEKKSGTYRNYYALEDKKYVLHGDAVTPKGAKSTTYYGHPYRDYSKPENTIAKKVLYSLDGLTAYDYGDLVSNGRIVGTYHKFHTSNIIVSGYNGDAVTRYVNNDAVLRLTGNDASATMRYSFESPRLPEGRYSIRARRVTDDSTDERIGDSVVLNEVAEIIYTDLAYNHTALLYVKLKVSDQISSSPKVTFENYGRVIRVWDAKQGKWVSSADINVLKFPITQKERADYPALTAAQHKQASKKLGTVIPNVLALNMPPHTLPRASDSLYVNGFYDHDNPAWIAWDMLTDDRFGGGLDPNRLDFWAFKKWADYCREKRLTFRAIVDGKETLWDAIAAVFRAGRAVPVRTGTRYTVSVEMPKSPVMSFGVDNIIEGSFAINWAGQSDRANEVELTYYDEEYDFRQRVIKVYDKQALARGAKPVTTSTKIMGIVTNEHAVREANFMLNTNKLVETVTFAAPVEALACTIGSVVEVQHNMMTWGEAGKLESVQKVSTGVYDLILDHPVNFEAGKAWKMSVQTSVVNRGVFTVESILGGYVVLTGFDDKTVGRVTRAKVANVETPVFDVFTDSNGKKGVVVRDFDAFAVGAKVTLFDTDVIESASATPAAYGVMTDRVRVTGLAIHPEKLNHFMLGFPEFKARLFTIRSIGLTGNDLTRQITALEYDERVFDDSDTDFLVTDNAYERVLSAVENVEITETAVFEGGGFNVQATVTWTHSSPQYKHAEVTATINENQVQRLGRQMTHASLMLKAGDRVDFMITPYSISGKKGVALRTGVVVSGIPTNANNMPVTGGSVTPVNGGLLISNLSFDPYRVKQVEVWAIRQGTVIPDGYGSGVPGKSTLIENVANHAGITKAGVELFGKTVGHADSFGRFNHVITDRNDEKKLFFYWARTIDLTDSAGPFSFIGSGRPTRSAAFNDVTVYTYSQEVPERPTGGTYDNPQPSQAIWKKTPDPTATANPKAVIFMSSRRFCSVEELTDPEWSMPAAIYDPAEAEIIEPSIKPVNVEVTAALGAVRVSWDMPRYEGHEKTQVFVQRVLVDADYRPLAAPALDTHKMLAAEETSSMVNIPSASGYGYYVWVRHVNKAGIQGPFHLSDGSFVMVKLSPEEMSKLLDKQIKFDFLNDDVTEVLDKAIADAQKAVDSIDVIVVKADESLTIARESVEVAKASEVKAAESLDMSTTAAEVGLRLLMQHDFHETDRRIEWHGPYGVRSLVDQLRERMLGEGGEIKRVEGMIGAVQGGASSGLKELSESIALIDSSMATKVNEIYAKFEDVDVSVLANISEVKTSIADANKAISDLTNTVAANKTAANSQLASEISNRKQAITDEAGARASDISSVRSSITSVDKKVDAEVVARSKVETDLKTSMAAMESTLKTAIAGTDTKVSTEVTNRTLAISEVNNSLSQLDTKLTGMVSTANANLAAEVTDRKKAVADTNSAMSSMETRLAGSIAGVAGQVSTEVTDRKKAVADTNSAMSVMDTRLSGSIAGVAGQVATEVSDRKKAVADTNSAMSGMETRLTGSIAGVAGQVLTEVEDRKAAVTDAKSATAAAESRLAGSIAGVNSRVDTEILERKTAITTVSTSLTELDTRLSGAVAVNGGKIATEISDRKVAQATTDGTITALDTKLTGSINTLTTKVNTEITDRKAAVATVEKAAVDSSTAMNAKIDGVSGKVAAETLNRQSAISTVNTSLAALDSRLSASITGTNGNLNAEIADRKSADVEIGKSVSALETRLTAKVDGVDDKLDAEITERKSSAATTNSAVAALDSKLATQIASVTGLINAEVADRKSAVSTTDKAVAALDSKLSSQISTTDGRVTAEVTNRQSAVSTVAKSVTDLETKLAGSIATVDGKVNTEITNRTTAITAVNKSVTDLDTKLSGQITTANGSIAAEVADRKTAVVEVGKTISALDLRLTGSITGVDSKTTTEIADRKTAITGVNNSITALDTKLSGQITTTNAAVATEVSDRKAAQATADKALTTLDTKLSGQITTTNSAITAEVTERKAAQATTDKAVTDLNTKLTGQITTVDGKVNAEVTNRTAAVAAVNQSITTLDSKLSGQITTANGKIDTEIADRKTAVTGVNNSLAALDTKLSGQITTEKNRITTEITDRKAAITTEQNARASLETTLNTSINGVKSSVTSLSSTVSGIDGKYNAQWGVKTAVGSLTGGVGFFNDGAKTSFLIDADVFALISRSATGSVLRSSPFKVVNGKAYLADAYIDSAVIGNLVAGKVTASYINALNVTAKYVSAGVSVSAPLITGGTLDMGNCYIKDGAAGFGPGGSYSGWGKMWNTIIYADGTLRTNRLYADSGTFTGQVNATSGNFSNVVIQENCTVRGTIYAEKMIGDVVAAKSLNRTISGSTDIVFSVPAVSTMNRDLVINGINVMVKGYTTGGGGDHSDVDRTVSATVSFIVNGAVVSTFNVSATGSGDSDVAFPALYYAIPKGTRADVTVRFICGTGYTKVSMAGAVALVTKAGSGTFA